MCAPPGITQSDTMNSWTHRRYVLLLGSQASDSGREGLLESLAFIMEIPGEERKALCFLPALLNTVHGEGSYKTKTTSRLHRNRDDDGNFECNNPF